MNDRQSTTSLPEKDYLSILDIITRLYKCETAQELKEFFREELMPLFDAQATAYGFTDPELSFVHLSGAIGFDFLNPKLMQLLIQYDPLTQKIISNSIPVMAYGVDLPITKSKKEIERTFLREYPQYKSELQKYLYEDNVSALITLDLPDCSTGVGFHHFGGKRWTVRDVRILELLGPHILQTVKMVSLNTELQKYKTLVEVLGKVDIPLVLVRFDKRIGYCNKTFEEMFECRSDDPVPQVLLDGLEKEISRKRRPDNIESVNVSLPLVSHQDKWYRLDVAKLNHDPEGLKFWLLRLKPAQDPYSQLNLKMQECGLTPREMEICQHVRRGFDNDEIAHRLFISSHTVKTHLKPIFEKMAVNSLAKLMATLSPG